jgi:hypothetical protein
MTERTDMSAQRDVPRFMALTRVKAGRADEFETFLREVVAPAVAQARPNASGLWQTLIPDANSELSQTDAQGVAAAPAGTYVFVFYGDLSLDEWDLGPVFTEVHGEEKGNNLAREFEDFVEGDQVVLQFSGQI